MKSRLTTLLLIGMLSLCLVAAALALASRTGQNAAVAQIDLTQPRFQSAPPHSLPTNPSHSPTMAAAPAQPKTHPSPGSNPAEAVRQQLIAASQPALPANFESAQGPAGSAPALPDSPSGTYLQDGVTLDQTQEKVYGRITPGVTITLTRQSDGAYGAAQSDSHGFFWTPLYAGDGSGVPAKIDPGDVFDFDIGGSPFSAAAPPEINGAIDLDADTVSGSIPGDTGGTGVTVTIGLWNQTSDLYGAYIAVTDSNGAFSIQANHDLGAENFAQVEYLSGGIYSRNTVFPNPHALLVWQDAFAGGYAPRGTQVDLTVFVGSSTTIRWQGSTNASFPFGWWQLDNVEMAPGDAMIAYYADGATAGLEYTYASQFTFDVAADTVSGQTEPGEDVHVILFADEVYDAEVTADGSGAFTASFASLADLLPHHRVDFAIHGSLGSQSHMISGPPYLEAQLDAPSDYDCVMGRVDAPNAPLTLTLQTASGVYTRQARIGPSDPGNNISLYYCFLVWGYGWGPVGFSPGDVITFSTPTWDGVLTIPDITWQADTVNESVSASTPIGDVTALYRQWWDSEYPEMGSDDARGHGPNFSDGLSIDVRDGGSIELTHFDPGTGFAARLVDSLHFLQVNAPKSVYGHTPIPNEGVTAYLYDDLNNLLASTGVDHDADPYHFRFTDFGGYDILPGYRVELTSDSGWSPSITVPDVTIQGDLNQDLISGEAPKSLLLVEAAPDVNAPAISKFTPVDGYALNAGWFGYDLVPGDHVYATFSALDGSRARFESCMAELCRVESWSNYSWDISFWGYAEPGSTVTFTAPHDPQGFTAYADPACDGCFSTNQSTPLYPGESVTAVAGAGLHPVVITQPDPYVAHSDSWAGVVSGQLGGWVNLPVEVYPWGWGDPQTVQADANGNFSAAYTGMPNNARGHIRFMGSSGATHINQHKPFHDLSLQLRANYVHEWVEGDYEPGHQIWITLTNSLGQVKDTANGVTGPIPEWGGNSGFVTWGNAPWSSGTTPDLQVGDYIYVRSDAGYTADLRIGDIAAVLDVNTDQVSGNIYASWLVSNTYGGCGIWIENGPGIGFNDIDPDGGGFTCDFAAQGFDILPGMDVGVDYREPGQHDDDQIFTVLREPAPHLWINTYGLGTPGENSNYILSVDYNNDGDALATGVEISMTLLEGMSYITDTSGVPVSGTGAPGDPLIWNIGSLAPNWQYSNPSFQVFVQVTGAAGTPAHSKVQIATLQAYYQWDTWVLVDEWQEDIQPQEIDLSVGKSAWTGNPAPGSDFVYQLNACNNAGTNSGMVILTDTLPLSTTLLSWWSSHPGWQELARSDHLLVIGIPSLRNYWCGQVFINVHLDPAAWPGMELHNVARIWGAYDLDPTNDTIGFRHNADSPHPNLHIYKNWIWGRWVPGGALQFEFNVGNSGNVSADNVLVTATLPAGATFVDAYSWDWTHSYPFPPDIVTDEYLVWNLAHFPNGYWKDIGVRLDIDPSLPVGAQLPITISVMRLPWEDRFDDNQRTWVEVLSSPGSNLRVDKHTNWRWNSPGGFYYELRLMNLGTTTLQDFWITDTIPVNTTVDDFWQNHGPYSDWIINQPSGAVRLHVIDPLNPGDTASFAMELELDSAIVGIPGLGFTNTVDAPIPGDVFPADNHDQVAAWSGSDLYVNKYLSAGEPRFGEVVTFTVEFGNRNKWPIDGNTPYGSHITDTLPAGFTFLRATAPWSPTEQWDPESIDGQNVRWSWSPMWAEQQWWYQIAAQVTDPLPGALSLVNHVEAYSDNPQDVELDLADNEFDAPFTTLGPNFQVSKDYAGNGVAGTLTEYTLSVDNVGNEPGTDLTVTDWAPSWFTYLGGGAYNAGLVTWSIPTLEAGNTAQVVFSGTLSCTPGGVVNNQFYRVESSAEGISSPDGAPLSFTIAAPQIAASITAHPPTANPGQPVAFASTSTTDGTPLDYAWDFGDGGTSASSAPSHAFQNPGVYTVSLTVTDQCGFSDTFSMDITVDMQRVFMPLINLAVVR